MSAPSLRVCTFVRKFESFVVPTRKLAESWDNVGLLVEPSCEHPDGPKLFRVMLTNDLTEDVMDEALKMQAGLILSYHPPIFDPLKRIVSDNWKARIVAKCLRHDVAVYSPHTAFDVMKDGVTDWLLSPFAGERSVIHERIGTDNSGQRDELLIKKPAEGNGRKVILNNILPLSEVIDKVKTLIGQKKLRVARARGVQLDSGVNSIATCAGSGKSVLNGVGTDVWITGEMSHHDLLDATHKGSTVILCEHSNSERNFLRVLKSRLEHEVFSDEENLKFFLSETDRDPIEIF